MRLSKIGEGYFKSWLSKPPKDHITHGVDIIEWNELDSQVQFMIFDFAGKSVLKDSMELKLTNMY